MSNPLRYTLTVGEDEDGRVIKRLLQSKLKMSTRLLRQLPQDDYVRRNGHAARLNERATKGDIIEIMLPSEKSLVIPVTMALDICYEDDEILVVNKPAGLLTHPTARERLASIQSGLLAYLAPADRVAHCVHRLDRETSGLVMFAKHAHIHHLFDEALRKGGLHRVYTALVRVNQNDEVLQQPHGTWHSVELPIAQNPDKPSRRIIDDTGQAAHTDYRVVSVSGAMDEVHARQGSNSNQVVALLQLVLWTGRTHQIRLHMAASGMPLVGDPDYGSTAVPSAPAPALGLKRQALHAIQLGWQHPVTGEQHAVSAVPPADLRAAWRRVGGSDANWDALQRDSSALHRVRIL